MVGIVLTKIEDEDSIQSFRERVEEVMELNSEIGGYIQEIC